MPAPVPLRWVRLNFAPPTLRRQEKQNVTLFQPQSRACESLHAFVKEPSRHLQLQQVQGLCASALSHLVTWA